jgi:hypothetical protein
VTIHVVCEVVAAEERTGVMLSIDEQDVSLAKQVLDDLEGVVAYLPQAFPGNPEAEVLGRLIQQFLDDHAMQRDDVIRFHNQHQEYVAWAAQYPDGYVLNLKPTTAANAMLHEATCSHIAQRSTRPGRDLTANPKVCAAARHQIEAWARWNKVTIDRCPDCVLKREAAGATDN